MIQIWLGDNIVEVLGAIAGLIYLYFSLKQIIYLWPLGILSSLLYVVVFYNSRLYADMSLQVYYFFISIYGWYFWSKGSVKTNIGIEKLQISRLSKKMWLILLMIIIVLTLISGFVLSKYTNSSLPWWDAFTTSASIVATWMLARKILENWLFWIVIDIVSLLMYIYKGLYPTVLLFFVYSSMAFAGYFKWKKDLKRI